MAELGQQSETFRVVRPSLVWLNFQLYVKGKIETWGRKAVFTNKIRTLSNGKYEAVYWKV